MEKVSVKRSAFKLVLSLICLALVVVSCIFLREVPKFILVIAIVVFASLGVFLANINSTKYESIFKILFLSLIFCAMALIVYIIFDKTNFLSKFQDTESLLEFIRGTKYWGVLIYIALVILQVIALPLPGAVPAFIGGCLYGPLFAFIYMSIGTIIGSIITFMLGKIFGQKLVTWVVGKEKSEKYAKLLDEKGKPLFIAFMLFPFTPDDIICLVAGMSTMSYKFFIIAVSITRPLVIAGTCFLMDGTLIPFKGWGIPVWIAIFAITAVLYIVVSRLKKRFFQSKPKEKKSDTLKNNAAK